MRSLLLVSVLALSAAAGCLNGNGGTGPDDTDPFFEACEFPQVDNVTSLVGGAGTPGGQPIQGVEARATPQDPGLDEVVDTTNQAGCYFLSLDAGVVYDVTWAHDAYGTERQDAVRVGDGEKRVQHVYLQAF